MDRGGSESLRTLFEARQRSATSAGPANAVKRRPLVGCRVDDRRAYLSNLSVPWTAHGARPHDPLSLWALPPPPCCPREMEGGRGHQTTAPGQLAQAHRRRPCAVSVGGLAGREERRTRGSCAIMRLRRLRRSHSQSLARTRARRRQKRPPFGATRQFDSRGSASTKSRSLPDSAGGLEGLRRMGGGSFSFRELLGLSPARCPKPFGHANVLPGCGP